MVVVLAFSCASRDYRWIIGALAVSSLFVALLAVVQAFHIPWIGQWTFETYFASRNFTAEEVSHLAANYNRSYGATGPVGTAVLLGMSLGAWFVLVIRSTTTKRLVLASLGLNIVLVGIFLTGSRLGLVIAAPMLMFGMIWWRASQRTDAQTRLLAVTALITLGFVAFAAGVSNPFSATVETSLTRFVNTVPNLINGTPDESFKERLAEFSDLDLAHFDFTAERETGRTSEYVVLLKRYGLAGFLLVWQLWLMIVIRSMRAANNGHTRSVRNLGMMSLVGITSLIIGAIGVGAVLEPSRMTVLLVVFGLTPVLSPFQKQLPVPVPLPVPLRAHGRQGEVRQTAA